MNKLLNPNSDCEDEQKRFIVGLFDPNESNLVPCEYFEALLKLIFARDFPDTLNVRLDNLIEVANQAEQSGHCDQILERLRDLNVFTDFGCLKSAELRKALDLGVLDYKEILLAIQ